MPITFITFFAATLAICGIPPFAGFMSKDEILWQAFVHGHPIIWAMVWLGAGITAFYMFRQVYMTFFGEFRGTHEQQHHLHESPPSMTIVLAILGVLSAVGGFVLLPEFVGVFKPFHDFLEPVLGSPPTRAAMKIPLHAPGMEFGVSLLALAMALSGWFLANLVYLQGRIKPERFSEAFGGLPYLLAYNKYYVDEIYDALIIKPYLSATRIAAWFDANIIDGIVNFAATAAVFSSWLSGLFDTYIVDGLVNLASNLTLDMGGRLRRLQTGSINGYLYGILAAVMVILLARAMIRI